MIKNVLWAILGGLVALIVFKPLLLVLGIAIAVFLVYNKDKVKYNFKHNDVIKGVVLK